MMTSLEKFRLIKWKHSNQSWTPEAAAQQLLLLLH
ncbi:hypothetical protein FOFC_05997 [Fusarium oxysporum]|nr:hypothetical protein FOFC_05997 [Fusarium oxysporum]